MASPASPAYYENQDDFLLTRFIHELEVPVKIEEASMSATTTQPLVHVPSLGTARSNPSVPSITYTSRTYEEELEARGIRESDESLEELDDFLKRLQAKRDDSEPLTTEETEAFGNILQVPGNEPTIQALIVPTLLNLVALVRSPLTVVDVGAQSVTDCSIPLHRDMRDLSVCTNFYSLAGHHNRPPP